MEYINDFLYFVVKPHGVVEQKAFLYCSGVNATRFLAITKGRHGQGSNPAVRGLQLVKAGIMDMAITRGGKPKRYSSQECKGIAPTMDTWYTEHLVIEDIPGTFPEEAIKYSVINLIKKIANALRIEDKMPDDLLAPEELQRFIEKLCMKYAITEK